MSNTIDLAKYFDKYIVTVPKAAREQFKNTLKQQNLGDAEFFSSKKILHTIDFHKLIESYGRNKKNYLLKLLLNDAGLDIQKNKDGTVSLQLVNDDPINGKLVRNVINFLTERGSVISTEAERNPAEWDINNAPTTKEGVEVVNTVKADNVNEVQKSSDVTEATTKVDESVKESQKA